MSIKRRVAILLLGDILILYLSLTTTLAIRYSKTGFTESLLNHIFPFSIIFILWLIIFYIFDLYSPIVMKNRLNLAGPWSGSVLTGFLISIILFYSFGQFFNLTPKTNLVIFTLTIGFVGFFWRSFYISILKLTKWQTKFAMFGESENIMQLLNFIKLHPNIGYDNEIWLKDASQINAEKIAKNIKEKNINILVIHPEFLNKNKGVLLPYLATSSDLKIINFINFYEEIFRKVPIEDINENWFTENMQNGNRFYAISQKTLDIIISLLLIIILLPISILVIITIGVTSKGPIIFKQIRVGKNNKNFTLYKFRTMIIDAEKNGAKWAEKNDPRITKFGKFLRYTHLDEAPQLLNILKGDISFVGPRPERPEFITKLEKEISHFNMRHTIKPGITGWAQVNYRYGASVEDSIEKLRYDLYYISHRSIILDILIILKTIRMVFKNF